MTQSLCSIPTRTRLVNMARFTVACGILGLSVPAVAPLLAQQSPSKQDIEAAKAAYAKGAEAYEKDQFDQAVLAFKQSYRLSKNPLLLYNIGNALELSGDRKLALFYYKKFLADTPKSSSNRALAKERAKTLSRELATEQEDNPLNDSAEPASKEPARNSVEPTANFSHSVIEDAPPGSPIDVTAVVPENEGWKVYLFYRNPKLSEFTQVEMRSPPDNGERVGRIPAAAVRGSNIQYYIEARDIGDDVVARSGRASSPHLILIEEDAAAHHLASFDSLAADDDSPLLSPSAPSSSSSVDRGTSSLMSYAKWGSTGTAIGFVALSGTFFLISSDASSMLEGAAVNSNQQSCSQGSPCDVFGPKERALEARGKRFETLGNVFIALGLATGVLAGSLWYLDKGSSKPTSSTSITAVPTIGPHFVGATAAVNF